MTEKNPKEVAALYLRNFIFGVEDSLVSTVGLLSGIAVAGVPKRTILISGVVLIFVEAFSMAAGSFLSEHSAEEHKAEEELPVGTSVVAGTIMFFSYFIAGFIPFFPYLLFTSMIALYISIGISLIALFILGAASARYSKVKVVKRGMRMFIVGGIAIGLGVFVGSLLQI